MRNVAIEECRGCGAPVKQLLSSCEYCGRDYPRSVRDFDELAHTSYTDGHAVVDGRVNLYLVTTT